MRIKYYSIDCMRIIAAFFVVLIHFNFSEILGGGENLIHANAYFAVPFFFMVSGFFAFRFNKEKSQKLIKKQISKIGRIFLLTAIVYLLINIIFALYMGESIINYVKYTFGLKNIIKLLVINVWPMDIGGPIWYLQALLYSYLIFYFLYKYDFIQYDIVIAIIFLIINAVLGEFSAIFHVITIGGCFFTRALPYMLIGNYIARNQSRFRHMGIYKFTIIIICSIILTCGEYIALFHLNLLHYAGHFQGNTIMAIAIFIFLIQRPNLGAGSRLNELGNEDSQIIYLVHQPLGFFLNLLLNRYMLFCYLQPIVVFMASLLFSRIYNWVKKYRKIYF